MRFAYLKRRFTPRWLMRMFAAEISISQALDICLRYDRGGLHTSVPAYSDSGQCEGCKSDHRAPMRQLVILRQ